MKIKVSDFYDMTILSYLADGRIYVSLEDCYGTVTTARIPYRDVSSLRFGNEIPQQYLDSRGLLRPNMPIPAVLLLFENGRTRYALNEKVLAPKRIAVMEEAPTKAPLGKLRKLLNSIFSIN